MVKRQNDGKHIITNLSGVLRPLHRIYMAISQVLSTQICLKNDKE